MTAMRRRVRDLADRSVPAGLLRRCRKSIATALQIVRLFFQLPSFQRITTNEDEGSPEPPAGQMRPEGTTTQAAEGRRIPGVALGASAGGIDAFAQFFDAMPLDSGAAFIAVLHLDPTRESHLPSIVGHHTSMSVVEI
jgi:chemotaxis response regulator CheB